MNEKYIACGMCNCIGYEATDDGEGCVVLTDNRFDRNCPFYKDRNYNTKTARALPAFKFTECMTKPNRTLQLEM